VTQLVLEQALNGLQFGLMLFLLAAGLTLVFGIMDCINLAHGSLYMVGAYFVAAAAQAADSFWIGLAVGVAGAAVLGLLLDLSLFRQLYKRDHLSQVLATFALILIANEAVRMIWGAQPLMLNAPEALSGPVEIGGFFYRLDSRGARWRTDRRYGRHARSRTFADAAACRTAGRCSSNTRPGIGVDHDLPADGVDPVLQAARPVSGARLMAFYRSAPYQKPVALGLLLALVAMPYALNAAGQEFYIGFATRVLIFALAATSLNLVLGFGGMFSLGHATFFGAGAYVAAFCMSNGISEALIAFPLAMILAGLLALLVGALSLRTRGVYFIMITLAFAQMIYYLFISARALGGDDGLPLAGRMTLAGFSLSGDSALFYAALGCLALALIFLRRLADARFGHTIQAIRENESRMEGLGYPVFRYRLVCFALGGALAGLAGALLANLTGLASPNVLQ
jgi:branched-chain amino acid transport system permease protein